MKWVWPLILLMAACGSPSRTVTYLVHGSGSADTLEYLDSDGKFVDETSYSQSQPSAGIPLPWSITVEMPSDTFSASVTTVCNTFLSSGSSCQVTDVEIEVGGEKVADSNSEFLDGLFDVYDATVNCSMKLGLQTCKEGGQLIPSDNIIGVASPLLRETSPYQK